MKDYKSIYKALCEADRDKIIILINKDTDFTLYIGYLSGAFEQLRDGYIITTPCKSEFKHNATYIYY